MSKKQLKKSDYQNRRRVNFSRFETRPLDIVVTFLIFAPLFVNGYILPAIYQRGPPPSPNPNVRISYEREPPPGQQLPLNFQRQFPVHDRHQYFQNFQEIGPQKPQQIPASNIPENFNNANPGEDEPLLFNHPILYGNIKKSPPVIERLVISHGQPSYVQNTIVPSEVFSYAPHPLYDNRKPYLDNSKAFQRLPQFESLNPIAQRQPNPTVSSYYPRNLNQNQLVNPSDPRFNNNNPYPSYPRQPLNNFQTQNFPNKEMMLKQQGPGIQPQVVGPLPPFKSLKNSPPGTTFIIRNTDGAMRYALDPTPSQHLPLQNSIKGLPFPDQRQIRLIGPGETFQNSPFNNPNALYTNPSNPIFPVFDSNRRPFLIPNRNPGNLPIQKSRSAMNWNEKPTYQSGPSNMINSFPNPHFVPGYAIPADVHKMYIQNMASRASQSGNKLIGNSLSREPFNPQIPPPPPPGPPPQMKRASASATNQYVPNNVQNQHPESILSPLQSNSIQQKRIQSYLTPNPQHNNQQAVRHNFQSQVNYPPPPPPHYLNPQMYYPIQDKMYSQQPIFQNPKGQGLHMVEQMQQQQHPQQFQQNSMPYRRLSMDEWLVQKQYIERMQMQPHISRQQQQTTTQFQQPQSFQFSPPQYDQFMQQPRQFEFTKPFPVPQKPITPRIRSATNAFDGPDRSLHQRQGQQPFFQSQNKFNVWPQEGFTSQQSSPQYQQQPYPQEQTQFQFQSWQGRREQVRPSSFYPSSMDGWNFRGIETGSNPYAVATTSGNYGTQLDSGSTISSTRNQWNNPVSGSTTNPNRVSIAPGGNFHTYAQPGTDVKSSQTPKGGQPIQQQKIFEGSPQEPIKNTKKTEIAILPVNRGEMSIHPKPQAEDDNRGLSEYNEPKKDNEPQSHSAILQQYLQRAKQVLRKQQIIREQAQNNNTILSSGSKSPRSSNDVQQPSGSPGPKSDLTNSIQSNDATGTAATSKQFIPTTADSPNPSSTNTTTGANAIEQLEQPTSPTGANGISVQDKSQTNAVSAAAATTTGNIHPNERISPTDRNSGSNSPNIPIKRSPSQPAAPFIDKNDTVSKYGQHGRRRRYNKSLRRTRSSMNGRFEIKKGI